MENQIENLDSTNEEIVATEETTEETTATPNDDVAKLTETNKQLFERAKKAEQQVKELKSKIVPESQQPIDIDRLDRLELKASKIDHPDDQKFIIDTAKRLKLDVTEVINDEFIQGKLKANREAREAREGLPSGTRRASGVGRNDVEYYLAHPDLRPDDQALAAKVIAAKQAQVATAGRFSDNMY
jgi:hypothetical protein